MEQIAEQVNEKRYMSYRDAEFYTGLSRWTLQRASARGDLRKITVGSMVRFDRADLDNYMKERRS